MTASKQPELPALTEEELAEMPSRAEVFRFLLSTLNVYVSGEQFASLQFIKLRFGTLLSMARRCLSAERELAELRAAVDKHFPNDGFLPEVTREETLAGCRAALDMFREMALTELPKLFGTGLEKAERSLSEVKAERDELRAKVARLEEERGAMSERRVRLLLGERFASLNLTMEDYSHYSAEQKSRTKPFTNYPGWNIGWHASWPAFSNVSFRDQVRGPDVTAVWRSIEEREFERALSRLGPRDGAASFRERLAGEKP